jgi:hypothetical protein
MSYVRDRLASVVKLARLSVTNASQENLTGDKNWAAVRQPGAEAVIRAVTAPHDSAEEWRQIQWSGDGEPVKGKPNERRLSLEKSAKRHVEVRVGETSDHLDLWILWAGITILTSGPRPAGSAPFDLGMRDNTQDLGAVTYQTVTSSVVNEAAGEFVNNMGASGKVAPVAVLSPKGVNGVVKSGWAFQREVWSRNFMDGRESVGTNKTWTRDTSKPAYLRLTPDANDKIYDLDGPDLRWGSQTSETYNNFRQWIEWNGKTCSEYAAWYWKARWRVDRDPRKQITLNELATGNTNLPARAYYRPPPAAR